MNKNIVLIHFYPFIKKKEVERNPLRHSNEGVDTFLTEPRDQPHVLRSRLISPIKVQTLIKFN